MAASQIIEEESGTSRGWVHQHNGYYAGDFSHPRFPVTVGGDGYFAVIRSFDE